MAKQKGPGKAFRKGLSVPEFFRMFPDDAAAEAWFVDHRWRSGMACPHCGSVDVRAAKHRTMPYRCREKVCGKHFSAKTGTFMESSKIGYRAWLFAIYMLSTNLKSVSSMKLHRDLGITQKSAWHLAHRIREAWTDAGHVPFDGPVEADECYVGGRRRNMHARQRRQLEGRGGAGKAAVVGLKDRATNQVRARVVEATDGATLRGFVEDNAEPGAQVYTDDASGYKGLPNHQSVRHSVAEYVRGQVHTNGIESHWSMLKRAHKGTFHKLSAKHLQRYVDEFSGRHNMRPLDTLDQMAHVVRRMENARLRYRDLIA